MEDLEVTPTLTIPAWCLSWTATSSSGPGGQHVNRTATRVDLRFYPDRCPQLPPFVLRRLNALAVGRRGEDGSIRFVCGESRSQFQNLQTAREQLADLLRRAMIRPKRRVATRPTLGSKRRRLDTKRKLAEKKRERSRGGEDQ